MSHGIGTRTVTVDVMRCLLPMVLRSRGYAVSDPTCSEDGFLSVDLSVSDNGDRRALAGLLGRMFRNVTLVDGHLEWGLEGRSKSVVTLQICYDYGGDKD